MRLREGRLVIGIPTVPRERDYLEEVVAAIVRGASRRAEMVVFDASATPHPAAERVARRFPVTVIANRAGYPGLADGAGQDRNPRHWMWRKKLALDLAFLARACAGRGDYWLHVQDDVVARPRFLERLTEWFDGRFAGREDWALLSLWSADGFADGAEFPLERFYSACALLFRAGDLARLAGFLEARAGSDSADFLIRDWARAEGRRIFVKSPPLFQHVGVFSSRGDLRAETAALGGAREWARAGRELVEVALRHPSWLPALLRARREALWPPVVRAVKGLLGL